MKKNDDIKLNITALASTGNGLGRIDNQVVFVPYALPGEEIEAHVIKCAKNYSVAKLTRVITPSEHRKKPACPYFYRCGGCDFQHFDYSSQLNEKCVSANQNINKISGLELECKMIIPAENVYNYRNKAQFPVNAENGKINIGFFAPRSHRIVNIDKCLLQKDECNSIIGPVREAIELFNIPVYNEETHTGIIRHAISRSAESGVMLIVVTNSSKRLPQNFVDYLSKNIPNVKSIVQNINTVKGNIILGNKCLTLFGEDFIQDKMCDIEFNLRPLAFLQVNRSQAEKLYVRALELAGDISNCIVFDAYCGIGIMSLMLAKKCKKLIGVEIVPDAIASAKESAKINNIENADFICGACEDVLPELIKNGSKPDVLVVDPPRAGCEKSLLDAIANAKINKIVYVSCDHATLARDIKILSEYGYIPSNLTFVDMFPQTKHVETVCLLSLKK